MIRATIAEVVPGYDTSTTVPPVLMRMLSNRRRAICSELTLVRDRKLIAHTAICAGRDDALTEYRRWCQTGDTLVAYLEAIDCETSRLRAKGW